MGWDRATSPPLGYLETKRRSETGEGRSETGEGWSETDEGRSGTGEGRSGTGEGRSEMGEAAFERFRRNAPNPCLTRDPMGGGAKGPSVVFRR